MAFCCRIPKEDLVPPGLEQTLTKIALSEKDLIQKALKNGMNGCVSSDGTRICKAFVNTSGIGPKPRIICRNGPIIGLLVFVRPENALECPHKEIPEEETQTELPLLKGAPN